MIRGAEPQDANVDPLLKYPSPRAFIMINGRDHRIDFFRGLALVFIFWDHIPGNPLANLTVRNFGFSDAAEIFVFLAGYAAVLAYGKVARRDGWLVACVRILRLSLIHISEPTRPY